MVSSRTRIVALSAMFSMICTSYAMVSSSIPSLQHWITSNGGFVHPSICAKQAGELEGFGLFVKEGKSVREGEVMVTIPPKLHLSYDKVVGKDVNALIDREVPAEKWDIKLALALLCVGVSASQGTSQDWVPYLESLPRSLDNLPIFAKGSSLKQMEVRYPGISSEVIGRVALLKTVSSSLANSHACFEGLSVRRLAWAYGIATSRSVRLDTKKDGLLLPFVDFANHDFEPNAQIRKSGSSSPSAELVAQKDLSATEQITICYGNLDNEELLLNYGFEISGNKHKKS